MHCAITKPIYNILSVSSYLWRSRISVNLMFIFFGLAGGERFIKSILLLVLILFGSCCGRSTALSKRGRWVAGPNVGRLDLLSVDFIDAQTGWVVGEIDPGGAGGVIYQTPDGGRNWRVVARSSEILTSVHFITPKIGWVAGHSGRIERTDDGGMTWKAQRVEREGEVLNSIFFVDEWRGWVVGGSGMVLRTMNGGEAWKWIGDPGIEDRWSVAFSSTGRGWITGEDGLILSTADGGNTWTAQTSGTSRALLGLAVLPSMTVIAVGEAGAILRSPDGSNWSAVESATTATLNSVAASAEIICAVGSKGTSLESTDDGKTWTVVSAVSSRDLNSIRLTDATHAVAVGQRGVTQVLQ